VAGDQVGQLADVHLGEATSIDGAHAESLRPAVYTASVTPRPILQYERAPLDVQEWDPGTVEVATEIARMVQASRPDIAVEHIGSSAVPGLPGKNVVDLGIEVPPPEVPAITELLLALGFQPTTGPRAFPITRPLFIGAIDHGGRRYRIHAHVHPTGHRVYGREQARDLAFRDALRADPGLRAEYAARKRAIAAAGIEDTYRYSLAKTEWIRGTLERIGVAEPPILPPATIGILGGGQLGRMLGMSARRLGYRIVVLDPDPACPSAAVADEVVVGAYDDTAAAERMAARADLVTLELEHVGLDVVTALDREWPVRPGTWAVHLTQNRIAERRFVESEGGRVAPWYEVTDNAELQAAAEHLGLPIRIKAATGGYDGRSQLRVASPADLSGALSRLGRPAGEAVVVERELDFAAELSVIVAKAVDGRAAAWPVTRNRHDEGIFVESVTPAPIPDSVADEATQLAMRLAEGLDLIGTVTVELFLMPDGSLVVNELAPRVHNSGHWTIEGADTSQFEQHVRAITGLPLGSTALRAPAAATVNLLGSGAERAARPAGLGRALATPGVHVHLYDKRRVFERRKMGHVTALGTSTETALATARAAAALISWEA
jgi:5-(carboxyamino)imidazole ribonucleotide synthase